MAEDITHPIHNPFDVPPPKRGKGFLIAGLMAVLLHVILGVVLWKQRFEMTVREYSDDVTDVAIIKPMAPPPPPPPPPRPRRRPVRPRPSETSPPQGARGSLVR
jgi:protein TonB